MATRTPKTAKSSKGNSTKGSLTKGSLTKGSSTKPKPTKRIPPFSGYSKQALTWLRGIARRVDDRDWFLAHKAVFESEVKAATEALTLSLAAKMEAFAPEYVPSEPAKAVQRIYRDMRFSREGVRYKTALMVRLESDAAARAGASADGGRGPSFWFSVSGKGVDLVGGAYRPGTARLTALREHIAAHPGELDRILGRKPLHEAMGALRGLQRKHAPLDVDPEHPAIHLLKHTQLYLQVRLPVALMTTPDLPKAMLRRFKLMVPFMSFLEAGFSEAE